MNTVFLILVFLTSGQLTVNTTTIMPNMDTCEQMLDYHMDDLPGKIDDSWGGKSISKPIAGYCKKVTFSGDK